MTKDFLKRYVFQNAGTKIASAVIAGVLWTVVLGSRNVEENKEVLLEVITSPDIVVANDITSHITFRLSGPQAFLRAIRDRRGDPIRINLTREKPGVITHRLTADDIRLPIGVKILSITPPALMIKLEMEKKRVVPVKLELRGILPAGLKVKRIELNPSTVKIRGAESRVDSVSEISTQPVNLSSVEQSEERSVSLDLARFNVQTDDVPPKFHLEVERIPANFRIKNVDIRVLSSYKFKADVESITVMVRSTSKDLKVDEQSVYGLVDLRGKAPGNYLEPVKVHLPSDLTLVKVVPDHVKITLY